MGHIFLPIFPVQVTRNNDGNMNAVDQPRTKKDHLLLASATPHNNAWGNVLPREEELIINRHMCSSPLSHKRGRQRTLPQTTHHTGRSRGCHMVLVCSGINSALRIRSSTPFHELQVVVVPVSGYVLITGKAPNKYVQQRNTTPLYRTPRAAPLFLFLPRFGRQLDHPPPPSFHLPLRKGKTQTTRRNTQQKMADRNRSRGPRSVVSQRHPVVSRPL